MLQLLFHEGSFELFLKYYLVPRTLLDILKILINFFYGDKLPQDETLLRMKAMLQLYAADSSELISR